MILNVRGGIEVKPHNKREEKTVRIFNQNLEQIRMYKKENTFGENTKSIIQRNLNELNGWLSMFYFMDMLVDELFVIFDTDL